MALLEENRRPGEFNFMWSIHKFSHCKKNPNEYLTSPSFFVGSIEMQLLLYPEGYNSTGFMSLFLRVVNYHLFKSSTCAFVLSLKRCDGTFKDSTEFCYFIGSQQSNECRYFISIDELNKLNAYLEHDVLTLRCRVWRPNGRVSDPSGECFAKTEIEILRLNYRWILEDLLGSDGILKPKFNRSTDILSFSSGFSTIKLYVSSGETFNDDFIYFAIEKKSGNLSLLFCVYIIHLLDSYGRIVHSICGEALLQKVGDIPKFPFLLKSKLLSNSKLYLPGGKLTLQCELSFSGDLVVNCVEYGKTDMKIFNSEKPNEDSVSDGHELWKENMRQFYSDGEFSDLLVRSPNREFPVHRVILCAQSEVFRGMMSHDMKEKNSGVIEINDFEDDTVSKLLLYLYTNSLSLDDIDYALARDLYFAADKYRITPLQKICSNHLIESIDSSNACDILLLAEQLRDLELKATARNLIASSPYEIMNSGAWKNLVDTNPHLTSETMQWMIFTNFLSHKK